MQIHTLQQFDASNFSPQMIRIIQHASIEAGSDDGGNRITPQHILVAFLQDGTSAGAELLNNCGLTVADIRAANFKPKHTN